MCRPQVFYVLLWLSILSAFGWWGQSVALSVFFYLVQFWFWNLNWAGNIVIHSQGCDVLPRHFGRTWSEMLEGFVLLNMGSSFLLYLVEQFLPFVSSRISSWNIIKGKMSLTCHILIRTWDKHSFLIATFFLKVDEIICFSSMKSPFCQWKGLVMRKSSQLVLPSLLIMSHNWRLRPPATRYSLNTLTPWLYLIASVLFLVTWSFANVTIVSLVVVKLIDCFHHRFIVHNM